MDDSPVSATIGDLSSPPQRSDPSAKKTNDSEAELICQWIKELADETRRENALLQIRYAFLVNL